MRSRNLKRFAASCGTTALVLAGMLFLGSALTSRAHSEGAGSHSGLEGAWRLDVTVRDCQTGEALRPTFPALFTFAKDGTLTLTTAGQPPAVTTPGLGVWQKTGDHTYSAVSEAFVFSPAGVQRHRLTRAIEVGDDGDKFTDTVKLEIFDTTTGNLIGTGCATSVASRFE
jgi:hypothetical protein